MPTAREAIKKLEDWYKDDLDQPITLFVFDRDEIWNDMVSDRSDEEVLDKYPTPKDLPKELVERMVNNLFEGDVVWEAIRDSEIWEWDNWHTEETKKTIELNKEQELWDTEVKNNGNR